MSPQSLVECTKVVTDEVIPYVEQVLVFALSMELLVVASLLKVAGYDDRWPE